MITRVTHQSSNTQRGAVFTQIEPVLERCWEWDRRPDGEGAEEGRDVALYYPLPSAGHLDAPPAYIPPLTAY